MQGRSNPPFHGGGAVRVLFPLSPGKGGEGDRTRAAVFSVSPSPSGKGLGVRGLRAHGPHSARITGVAGLGNPSVECSGLDGSGAPKPFSSGSSRNWSADPNPLVPFPDGEGE